QVQREVPADRGGSPRRLGSRPKVSPLARGLLFAVSAAAGNLLGGYFVIRRVNERPFLTAVLATGAGFMLAAVVLEMIPHSLMEAEAKPLVPILVLGGYLLIQFCEHTLSPHFHFG